jgi:hypothetical protein
MGWFGFGAVLKPLAALHTAYHGLPYIQRTMDSSSPPLSFDCAIANCRPVRLACQPLANSIFLSEQTSHQQPASSAFLSEQISTSRQPPAKRTGFAMLNWPCGLSNGDLPGELSN